jgi:hypothetical protein
MNESQPGQAVTRDTGLGHADTRKAVDSVIATVGKTRRAATRPTPSSHRSLNRKCAGAQAASGRGSRVTLWPRRSSWWMRRRR